MIAARQEPDIHVLCTQVSKLFQEPPTSMAESCPTMIVSPEPAHSVDCKKKRHVEVHGLTYREQYTPRL